MLGDALELTRQRDVAARNRANDAYPVAATPNRQLDGGNPTSNGPFAYVKHGRCYTSGNDGIVGQIVEFSECWIQFRTSRLVAKSSLARTEETIT